jgi:hypothetical protein
MRCVINSLFSSFVENSIVLLLGFFMIHAFLLIVLALDKCQWDVRAERLYNITSKISTLSHKRCTGYFRTIRFHSVCLLNCCCCCFVHSHSLGLFHSHYIFCIHDCPRLREVVKILFIYLVFF